MSSNFSFLEKRFPSLYEFGSLAENYVYSDPNSSLYKLRTMSETMLRIMAKRDGLFLKYGTTFDDLINLYYHEELITDDIRDILHSIRKAGNLAVHENKGTSEEALAYLEMIFSIAQWFFVTYADWTYEEKKFVAPAKATAVSEIKDQDAEEKKDAEIIKAAEDSETTDVSVTKEDRKKQAYKAANQRPKTEAETRILIDEQLRKVGWEADTNNLRYSKGTRPQTGHNIAIAEWPTLSVAGKVGYADYALFKGLKFVGVIEAKAIHKDISSVIDGQCRDYARDIRKEDEKYIDKFYGVYKVPFAFATNGRPYIKQYETKSGIWFRDLRVDSNPPRALRGWMSPIGIEELLERDPEGTNAKLKDMPLDLLRDRDGLNLREYQINAIQAAENAIINGQDKVLLAMATGTGKTRTVLGMIYRFLKSNKFRRILFLVDRNALGEQAGDVFKEVKLEDLMPLSDIYNVKELSDKTIDKETRIQLATVQSLVKRILYNDDDTMPAVTDYDLIIIDEAHRGYILDKEMTEEQSLYSDQKDYQSKYRSVVDYFDATKIALTATPALQTTEIFGKPIFQYTYREAVIEGYLVDHDAPHTLKTKLSTEGIHYKKGDDISIYDPKTGQVIDTALLNDELDFDIENFNKQIITREFNEAVLREIAEYIDPESVEKTLIYAVDDQHADMIVQILKEIYSETGVNQEAIMKITGSTGGGDQKKVQEAIRRFKNEKYPSVAVTVDLLTTGIDVPQITSLVFMRRVKSRILFEQMLGRATRLCPEIHKTHFEIYDPVGVYDSLEPVTDMKPVVASTSTTIPQVLDRIEQIDDAEELQYQIDQIIAKIQRRSKRIDEEGLEQFKNMFDGKTPSEFVHDIPRNDPETAKARLLHYKDQLKKYQEIRINKDKYVVIAHEDDEIVSHTRGYGDGIMKPEDYLDSFSKYLKTHMNDIAALNIVCTKPSDLTRADLKSLKLTLDSEGFSTQQLNSAISQMTNKEIAADIISIVRRYAIGSVLLSHEERVHRAIEKLKAAHTFSKQEENWLKRIEKYLIEESVINVSVFDEDSRFKAEGGFTRIDKVFKNNLKNIVTEINTYLYEDGGMTA